MQKGSEELPVEASSVNTSMVPIIEIRKSIMASKKYTLSREFQLHG